LPGKVKLSFSNFPKSELRQPSGDRLRSAWHT
jgi:hypothetical protein